MEYFIEILIFLAGFTIISLASKQIGHFFAKAELPLITGFLFTGIVAGPYMLGLISIETTEKLRFVDEISLGFIAFAAGNELYLEELKSRFKIITLVTLGLLVFTFSFCTVTIFFLSDFIPFMREMPVAGRLAVSILAGAILVTRSPSSAIAIVNELRAKGPFTQTVLGVTMILDIVVITLYAINSSIANSLLTGLSFDLSFIVIFLVEMSVSLLLGYFVGKLIQYILSRQMQSIIKTGSIILSGYSVFVLSYIIREFTHARFAFEILLEPLLICMIASFIATNYSKHRLEFSKILHDAGPPVYIAFFTLTGASLSLDVLANTWQIALVLFAVRLVATFFGTFGYGVLAKIPIKANRIGWMSFITQAGLGLGLAKQAVVEFPEWGTPFATIIIAVIVLNQLIGPPMFKWALREAGEAHPRADTPEFDGILNAIIFGLEGQSLALARSLRSHGWQVQIATLDDSGNNSNGYNDANNSDIEILSITEINIEMLEQLKAEQAEAIIVMLSDEENYKICELAYEHFGTRNLVVRLNNRTNFKRFHALGVLIVDPSTAIVSLLDHFVRSPMAVSLLLGMEENQDSIELELRNPSLHGIALRDLRLPADTLIISVRRRGQLLVSHGYTRLEIGDLVTIVGLSKSLKEISLRFDTNREYALLHLIETVTPKELSSNFLEAEVKEIIREETVISKDRFDRFIEKCKVIDMPHTIDIDELFKLMAKEMAGELDIKVDLLFNLMSEREKESSTAISPGIAIPHIILEGEHKFDILLARCKEGIHFSETNPMVYAVFALVGTKDERNFHLRALSAIAQIVQDPYFANKWLKAKDEKSLRAVILQSKRKRQE
ncbi:MAG: PTS sugar transporter subunit IIA [Pseudomonadota bacterium]